MPPVELFICKGVGPVTGDTASAEQPIETLNLLNPSGFSVGSEGWIPKLPQTKSGGVYFDTPSNDGRIPIAYAVGNVIEVMKLTASGASSDSRHWLEKLLMRMGQAAQDFHTTEWQIEPVYLRWWAPGAPGPQFALIYSIDIAPNSDPFASNVNEITITIEREYGWTPVRPGGSPKEWTYYAGGLGAFSVSNASLLTGSDHLAVQQLKNKREWNAAQTALLSQNHLTIPAEDIPGDLPALATVSIIFDNFGASGITNGAMVVSRTTKPDLPVGGGVKTPNYILNAGDAQNVGVDTTNNVSDTGAPNSGATPAPLRGRVTFATTATDAMRLRWNGAGRGYIDGTLTRGRYAAFARARLSAAGSVSLHLDVTLSIASANVIQSTPVILTEQGTGGTGNTTAWGIAYLGVIQIPYGESRALVSPAGNGLQVNTSAGGINLHLNAARVSGTPELYVSDIILIPIDESTCMIAPPGDVSLSTGTAGRPLIIDGTGYSGHGSPGGQFTQAAGGIPFPATPTLQALTLEPKQDNTIHFFYLSRPLIALDVQFTVNINIVPRWSGVRDV